MTVQSRWFAGPLSDVLGTGLWTICKFVQAVNGQPLVGFRVRWAPYFTQHATLLEQLQVGGADGQAVVPGGIHEVLLDFGGLEDEQHQGRRAAVVPLGPVGGEVAAVVAEALTDPLGGDGPAFHLDEVGTPLSLVRQPEGGVGVDHVVLSLEVVADGGPGGGQHLQHLVVPGFGGLGGEPGGAGGDGVLMVLLRRQGAQGGSSVDQRPAPAATAPSGAPAAQGHSYCQAVPACQVAQAVIGEDVASPLFVRQGQVSQGLEHLPGPTSGDAPHQPGELLGRAEGPGGQQVQGLLLGGGECHCQAVLHLPRRVGHQGPQSVGVEGVRVGLGLALGTGGLVPGLGVAAVQVVPDLGQDVGQGHFGCDGNHGGHAVAALLPGHGLVISGQLLSLGGHEVEPVRHGMAQGAHGPAVGLVGAGQHQGGRGLLAVGEILGGSEAVAQVGGGQRGPLADDAQGASLGECNQGVVGSLAVVVHPDGLAAGVGVGDESGDVIDHGHGVQSFGQDAEPLPGHRVLAEETLRAVFGFACGDYACFRGEEAELGTRTQVGQAVGHGVDQALGRQPVQLVAQGGLGNPSEAGQFLHGGQGRGAQQQESVLLAFGQPMLGRAAFLQLRQGVVHLPQQLPLALGAGDQLLGGRVNGLWVVAHGPGHGAGQGAAQVSPFQEAPEGVAGDAEALGRLGPAMPQGVGPHVVADGVVEGGRFRRRVPGRHRRCRYPCLHHIPPKAIVQHIVQEKFVERNALQGITFQRVLWYGASRATMAGPTR